MTTQRGPAGPHALRIRGGRILDPATGRRGQEGDVCILDGRVVDRLPSSAPVLEARGLVVMPGAIEVHTHVAGPAVSAARLLCPEDGGSNLPSPAETGRAYARLGYTTILEAAVAPLAARAAHADLDAIPIVDKGLLVLLGNDPIAFEFIRADRGDDLREYVAWVLESTRAFGVKAANPGGVAVWRCGHRGESGAAGGAAGDGAADPGAIARRPPPDVGGLDDTRLGETLTPRRIIRALAGAVRDLGLPHPLHLHMNGLGLPGNATIALETIQALEGLPVHLTHLQFHAYGGRTPAGLRSRAADLAARINARPEITTDVGQVLFGPAVTISADAPAQHRLHLATGRKWFNLDGEPGGGCGIVPHVYQENRHVSAVQWAIGLELLLLIEDPRRVFLTTDHPNGGPFTGYPSILALLMDRSARDRALTRVHPGARERTTLGGIGREYTLEEIALLTRTGPARALGLSAKGHLAPGADGDVVLYDPGRRPEAMLGRPVAVVKEGVVVAREGTIVAEPRGRTLWARPARATGRKTAAFADDLRRAFDRHATVPFSALEIGEDGPARLEPVRALPRRGGAGRRAAGRGGK